MCVTERGNPLRMHASSKQTLLSSALPTDGRCPPHPHPPVHRCGMHAAATFAGIIKLLPSRLRFQVRLNVAHGVLCQRISPRPAERATPLRRSRAADEICTSYNVIATV